MKAGLNIEKDLDIKLYEVYFKDGDIMTAEETLRDGKITMDLLDKYEVEYIKKEKI